MAGIYTHVDAPDDAAAAADQYRAFTSACEIAEQAGLRGFERMVASSRVMLAHPGLCLTAVNPGRMLYGLLEMPWTERFRAHPVVRSARARILQVKDHEPTSKIGYGAHAVGQRLRTAVVSSGFADGFGHLNVTGDVLIEGRRAPIIGRRCFEHTVVDITDIPHASVGTEVLFGKSGTDEISQAELARAHSLPNHFRLDQQPVDSCEDRACRCCDARCPSCVLVREGEPRDARHRGVDDGADQQRGPALVKGGLKGVTPIARP